MEEKTSFPATTASRGALRIQLCPTVRTRLVSMPPPSIPRREAVSSLSATIADPVGSPRCVTCRRGLLATLFFKMRGIVTRSTSAPIWAYIDLLIAALHGRLLRRVSRQLRSPNVGQRRDQMFGARWHNHRPHLDESLRSLRARRVRESERPRSAMT